MQIINLAEIRQKKEEEARIKVEAQAKLEEMMNARGDDWNYNFYQLVDMFCKEYPLFAVQWDNWIEDKLK